MTPERIAEIRAMPHDNWRIVHELLDALDAANATLEKERIVIQQLTAVIESLRELADAVQDSMGSKGGIPMTDRLADAFARCGMDVEREVEVGRSSPAPVGGGVPEFPSEEVIRRAGYTRPGSRKVQDFMTGWRCCWELASRLPALKPGEVEEAFRAGYGKGHFDGVADHYGEPTKSVTDLFRTWQELRAQPTPTEEETDHG